MKYTKNNLSLAKDLSFIPLLSGAVKEGKMNSIVFAVLMPPVEVPPPRESVHFLSALKILTFLKPRRSFNITHCDVTMVNFEGKF